MRKGFIKLPILSLQEVHYDFFGAFLIIIHRRISIWNLYGVELPFRRWGK